MGHGSIYSSINGYYGFISPNLVYPWIPMVVSGQGDAPFKRYMVHLEVVLQ